MANWLVFGVNPKGIITEHDCDSDEEKENLIIELTDDGYTEIDSLIND